MLIIALFCVGCFFGSSLQAQGMVLADSNNCAPQYDSLSHQLVYTEVDELPEFDFLTYFTKHYRYPEQEQTQGTIQIEFVVTAQGKIIAPRIRDKAVNEHTKVENEALRVVNSMPRWKPGTCQGKAVPVKMSMPVHIRPRG